MAALKPLFDDVRQDPALRWFGAALALINALTAAFWLTVQPIARILDRGTEPICWPFLDQCARFRIWDESTVTGIVVAMGVAALLNAAVFALRRFCGHGCVLWMSPR